MTKGQLDYANFRARRIFEDWNDLTGAVPRGSSLYYELLSVLEDAVHCGAQTALGICEPLDSEDDLRARIEAMKPYMFRTETTKGLPVTQLGTHITVSEEHLDGLRKDYEACFGKPPWERAE